MPTLTRSHMPRRTFTDPRTGSTVHKLTTWDDSNCVATYMYMQALTPDERYLVFTSDRTGCFQLYRLELASGEVVQMTDHASNDRPPSDPDPVVWTNIHPDGHEVFYQHNNALHAIDVLSLEARVVARPARPDWSVEGTLPSFSADGRRLLVNLATKGDPKEMQAAVGWVDVQGGPIEELYRFPRRGYGLQHLLGATDGKRQLISFALFPDHQNDPQRPRDERARAWLLDPVSGKAEPFLVMPPGFRATHEFWGFPDRTRLYYHKKTVPTWIPASIESIAADGSDRRVHFTCDRKLGHSNVTRDGRWLVSDVQDPTGNELYLIDLHSGASRVLCWPDSTVKDGQLGHVHPFFSPTGRSVVYTSDRHGKAAVYMVAIA